MTCARGGPCIFYFVGDILFLFFLLFFQVILTAHSVDGIQLKGGTVLGTCKEAANLAACVERIRLWGINQLYVIGGDGSKWGVCIIMNTLCSLYTSIWGGVQGFFFMLLFSNYSDQRADLSYKPLGPVTRLNVPRIIGCHTCKLFSTSVSHRPLLSGNRAAQDIHLRCLKERLPCCVVGIPKSIENDILLIDK